MVSEIEDLNHVGAGLGAANLTLLLQDGGPGDGEVDKGSEFGSLEVSSEESINLLPHFCNSALPPSLREVRRETERWRKSTNKPGLFRPFMCDDEQKKGELRFENWVHIIIIITCGVCL